MVAFYCGMLHANSDLSVLDVAGGTLSCGMLQPNFDLSVVDFA